MTDLITKTAEEIYGIKADPSDVERLHAYIIKRYGGDTQEKIKKVFMSGEAAGFLTVNETYFFREPVHFAFLLNMLPSFEGTGIRICSAATATGCEAYSIAMLIEAYNRGNAKPVSYQIDAFDIDREAIKSAIEGVYGERSMREDGSSFRYMALPYVKKLDNGYQVDVSLRKNINFFVHNLMDDLSSNCYHLIFFRNAFIYFSQRARSRILENLSCALTEGGILLMGVSETAGASHESLREKNESVYSPGLRGSDGSSLDLFYFQKAPKVPIPHSPFPIP